MTVDNEREAEEKVTGKELGKGMEERKRYNSILIKNITIINLDHFWRTLLLQILVLCSSYIT